MECLNSIPTFRHIDSHHKLIRWRFVIHGCIDGFSRLVIYLHCCDNNFSHTVRQLFENSVQQFYWPRRVRSDQGMENIEVARVMLRKYGTSSKPFITGLSVHNQRIERLWKDVINYVVGYFRDLFYEMEDNGILDPNDEVDLISLYYAFNSKINKSLTCFICNWNNHALRTESSQTPKQLWIKGIYQNLHRDTIMDPVDQGNFDENNYGIGELDMDANIRTNNFVEIPRCPFEMTIDEQEIIRTIDVLQNDGNSLFCD